VLREIGFGGCRGQALAIAGDAGATDPACELSLHHPCFLALAEQDSMDADLHDVYRGRPVRGGTTAIPSR
jgi:PqqA peptide cyclase